MVMGNQDISAWDAEFHRSGRVIFAVRRALAFGGLVIVVTLAGVPIVSIVRDLDTRGTWFTIRVALLAVLLAACIALAVLILLGHPRVTVNATGIRSAWWRPIPWSEFEGTTLVRPTSSLAAPYLTIPPLAAPNSTSPKPTSKTSAPSPPGSPNFTPNTT